MVNVIVSSDPKYTVNKMAIQSTVVEVLKRYKVRGKVEIGVNIVGDKTMHEINKKYRGIDSTTDVLSFALEDPMPIKLIRGVGFIPTPDEILRLGDIIISYPQVQQESKNDGISIDEGIRQLVEHSMQHLLGMHQH